MADPVTLQDIYDLFKASQADLQASREEFDRRMAESKAEAERQMAEAKASREEFDRRMAEAKAEADQRMAEAKVEADRRMAKLEEIAANTSREVGRLGDRWGTFVENLVEPAVLRLFQARGIDIQTTYRRAKSTRPAARMEIDILAIDGDVAVAIEVKSRLTQQDIDDLCEKLQKFKLAFPAYASHRIYGAVAAIEFVQDVDRYAYRKGLFVIRQCGDSVELANDESFQPRAW
ncbi:hypothetical protein [Phormidium sp. FACHB-1136]|jgi:hypothetical protein|uniref:hypothetical protein n=1 Tax=Phormidium sp. FACHB-1136 TaxID=2692848 RepID=UPI001684CA3B|nr:hypothetical protein [Phormidium sp. FACHB-1136]MBD2425015.1 hypothetical protein [Phormidium sp. FACHB-1136]